MESAEELDGTQSAFAGDTGDVIIGLREGTCASVIPQLAARFGITQDGLLDLLRLSPSTIQNRSGTGDLLSSPEQDCRYCADRIWCRALGVLEDESAARKWITQENRALGGEGPHSLLDTEAGYELVLDTLGRIEYGVVS